MWSSRNFKVPGSIPALPISCMVKCPWARHWTAGRFTAAHCSLITKDVSNAEKYLPTGINKSVNFISSTFHYPKRLSYLQFISGHIFRQPSTITFTPLGNLEPPIKLSCMSCGRKPENHRGLPRREHANVTQTGLLLLWGDRASHDTTGLMLQGKVKSPRAICICNYLKMFTTSTSCLSSPLSSLQFSPSFTDFLNHDFLFSLRSWVCNPFYRLW